MATIKGDGIIIASGSSSTTQGFSLTEIQLNNFAVSEGIATFKLGTDTNDFKVAFCLFIQTSTASYLFPAIYSGVITDENIQYVAIRSSSSGLTSSGVALVCNKTTYQYTWNLADSGTTDTDLTSGNFTVKAYSFIL